jgi:hypothetical protein
MFRLGNDLTAKLIGLTLIAVTLTVFPTSVTDPVNVTKLFVLGGFTFALLGTVINLQALSDIWRHKVALIAVGLFLLGCVFALTKSKAPIAQSLYGVYGRNNGFLLYFLLIVLFICTLSISTHKHLAVIPTGLFIAGVSNLAYAYWVIAFGDFIPWNNTYGNLLGTFGNPNFIGSFFGIFSGLIFALLLAPETNLKLRVIYCILLGGIFYGIIETRAVQGQVLFIVAGGISAYYWIRARYKSALVPLAYLAASLVAFAFSILGTQKIGPFSRFLYQETVTLRGEYWYAAWRTGTSNPLAGVGFDSFGDWYRRSRRESALQLPGVDTVTNAAHNVYLDMFAFGGVPLFLAYVLITIVTAVAIVRVSIRKKSFDITLVTLVSIWFCYQLQSVISINQIGLVVWGWFSSAALIVYEKIDRREAIQAPANLKTTRNRVGIKQGDEIFSKGLKAAVFSVAGLLISVPPLSADTKWHSAQISQDANRIIATLDSSYLNPLSSFKLNSIIGVLETNNFSEQAHEIALRAVAFNPESYESWKNITLLSKSTEKEKSLARENMRRLDPLNPATSLAKE